MEAKPSKLSVGLLAITLTQNWMQKDVVELKHAFQAQDCKLRMRKHQFCFPLRGLGAKRANKSNRKECWSILICLPPRSIAFGVA